MSFSNELLTELYDGIQAVYIFLSGDLSREPLSKETDQKRSKFARIMEDLANKIHALNPSLEDVGTPLAPPPVATGTPSPTQRKHPPPDPVQEPEDYLTFEPGHANGDEPIDMYEAMTHEDNQQDEVYEEPSGGQETSEVYEEPVPSPHNSRENSGSGAEYMVTTQAIAQANGGVSDLSVDWSSVYALPKTGSKLKVSQLNEISIKGPLEKLGGKSHKAWQKRYCVLAGPLMYFYEKESSKTFNNFIAIPSFLVECSDTFTDKKHFAFKLTHQDPSGKKKDYFFRSTSSDNRDKWIKAMKKVIDTAQKSSSVTLPRIGSSDISRTPIEKRRSLSLGVQEELYEAEPQEQDVYEDVPNIVDNQQDEYVAVSPVEEDTESLEDYVDVDKEVDSSNSQAPPPPPPTTSPPGPPKEHPLPVASPGGDKQPMPPPPTSPESPATPPSQPTRPPKPSESRKLPPPPPSTVDTLKIYTQSRNGIQLDKVFVAQWDFISGANDELGLKRGDLVLVLDPSENADWWYGELLDEEAQSKITGRSGFFPRIYSSHAFEPVIQY